MRNVAVVALAMASKGRALLACACCVGTLSFPAVAAAEDGDHAYDVAIDFSRSDDLRLRIVSSVGVWVMDDPVKGLHGVETIAVETLVDQARGSTDPLVLALMAERCETRAVAGKHCDGLDFARRWTEADTQNQLAWLTLAAMLRHHGDEAGARAMFVRAAQASMWHEHDLDLARVIASHARPGLAPAPLHRVLFFALSQAGTWAIPFDVFGTLGVYCAEPGDLRVACARIVATMHRDTDTLLGLTLAAAYAVRAHVDPVVVASYRMASDAIHWSMRSLLVDATVEVDPAVMDDGTLRRENQRMQASIERGERRLAEDNLLRQGIDRRDAAARYVAMLTPLQLQQRAATPSSP